MLNTAMKKVRLSHHRHQRVFIFFIFLLPMLIGTIWQSKSVSDDKNISAPLGGYVQTDNYDMHYVSKGNGDVAVVFIAGSGTPCACTDFYQLQNELSDKIQAITFDHAGSGWSSKTTQPRTVENLESELKVLLESVAVDKPVIIVCHSVGSLEAIYFAQCNPDKVKGIIFLDSGDPEFYKNDSEISAEILNRGIAFTRTVGLNRLLCMLNMPIPLYGESERLANLPTDIAVIDESMFNAYAGSYATFQSIEEMNENAEKVCNGPHLSKLPILVLSSDSSRDWSLVQNALAAWSVKSKQVTIADSSHYLHWSSHQEVYDEMVAFIASIMELN